MGFLFPKVESLTDLFGEPEVFDGGGQWFLESFQSLRTVRPGMTTVFACVGSNDPSKLTIADTENFLRVNPGSLDRPINLNNLEYLYLTFSEPLTNMAPGRAAIKADLTKQINLLAPGQKFALLGLSEGAAAISDIYDELRTGSLQHRRVDLMGAVAVGSPRRQSGRAFPDSPDPAPGTSGAAEVRLSNTESLWWEMAVADDPVTCVSDTDDVGVWLRRFYTEVHKPGGTTQAAILQMAQASGDPDAITALQLFVNIGASGHVHYHDRFPFADGRSYFQIGVDYLNSLPAPSVIPQLHRLHSEPRQVSPGQVVNGRADFTWMNLPSFTGVAMGLKVSAYDISGALIADVVSSTPATATVINAVPTHGSTPRTLSGTFTMPAGVVAAKLLVEVAPEVMTTGIVRFQAPAFP